MPAAPDPEQPAIGQPQPSPTDQNKLPVPIPKPQKGTILWNDLLQRIKVHQPPPLTVQARNEAAKYTELYDRNLKAIAGNIANASRAENVLVPHIEEAHHTLKRCGLTRRYWFQKTEFEVGFGTLLLGLAPSISALAHQIIKADPTLDTTQNLWTWIISIPLLVAFTGIFFAVHGWVRSD
jgi:hypothetical protein